MKIFSCCVKGYLDKDFVFFNKEDFFFVILGDFNVCEFFLNEVYGWFAYIFFLKEILEI